MGVVKECALFLFSVEGVVAEVISRLSQLVRADVSGAEAGFTTGRTDLLGFMGKVFTTEAVFKRGAVFERGPLFGAVFATGALFET